MYASRKAICVGFKVPTDDSAGGGLPNCPCCLKQMNSFHFFCNMKNKHYVFFL